MRPPACFDDREARKLIEQLCKKSDIDVKLLEELCEVMQRHSGWDAKTASSANSMLPSMLSSRGRVARRGSAKVYLSEAHLVNWRSYADARFDFKPPTARRPLVLIGAMNGHGKTSFLLALYLGLFGRFGLRHAEGFASYTGENTLFYRKAVSQFRRSSASPDVPTTVELVFAPTDDDGTDGVEVKLVQRWFFTAAGLPRQGDSFETAELYIDGKV